MDKKNLLKRVFDVHVWAVAIAIIGITTAIAQITITTYYPAPYGEYNVVRGITSGTSMGRIESDAYFDEPSGYGTSTPPAYWLNINGYQISSGSSVLGPPTTTNTNVASRLPTLGVKQLFDLDSPPVSTSVWAPILDMNGLSKMQDLEINGNLRVKGNIIYDGNLTVAGTTTLNGPVNIATNKLLARGVLLDDITSPDGQVDFHNNVYVHAKVTKRRCDTTVNTMAGKRSLTCIESPEVRFIDEGFAQLKNGIVKVKIDEIFKNNIETDNYSVYLTSQDDCKGIWVAEKTSDYFSVK